MGSADDTSLVYVSDAQPGIRRLQRGKNFSYVRPDGSPIRDEAELTRIRKLAIPPAYTDVWICPNPRGHLQATGRDARGRKQYRYHPDWRQERESHKFEHMIDFGHALPKIRAGVERDLEGVDLRKRLTRRVVLATIVRLLDTTLIRVGNDEYARTNKSYGLTTLRNRHAEVKGSTLQLSFKGKSGVPHKINLSDPRVARVVRRCQSLPGHELFEYEDEDGEIRTVGSSDVNSYLQELAGGYFTAKDFRTWHASVHALDLLRQACQACDDKPPAALLTGVLQEVASRLGNTPAVCRKSYVHPEVLAWGAKLKEQGGLPPEEPAGKPPRLTHLEPHELRLLQFLEDLEPVVRDAAA